MRKNRDPPPPTLLRSAVGTANHQHPVDQCTVYSRSRTALYRTCLHLSGCSLAHQRDIATCTTVTVASKCVTSWNLPPKRNPVHFCQQRPLPVVFRKVDTTPCLQRRWRKGTDRSQSRWTVFGTDSCLSRHSPWRVVATGAGSKHCERPWRRLQVTPADVSTGWRGFPELSTDNRWHLLRLNTMHANNVWPPTYLRQLCLTPITLQSTPFVAPSFTPSIYPSHCSDLSSMHGHTKCLCPKEPTKAFTNQKMLILEFSCVLSELPEFFLLQIWNYEIKIKFTST